MNANDKLQLSGALGIVITGKDGVVKESKTVPNLVVNAGLAFITSRMTGTAKAVMSHMAVGAGTSAAAATDTYLGSLL